MKKLIIDTTDKDEAVIGLEISHRRIVLKARRNRSSQAVLPLIVKILKDNNISLKELDAIEVNPGPGSYTGIRVGISIANALASILKVPINSKKIGELVEAKYK